jgi:hypothetical protein|tara:strand:+ start:138 stop:752 length:615 start_codon:yes stop_codon:yes gene_type:complete
MIPLEAYSVLIISGILIRYALIYAGQAWAKTYSQTISFLLLPIIAYIITKTIAGNIALSLGMIGALSIVRFRHPVKSALELIIYFDLITIGISTSVRTKWAIQLAVCTIVIIIAVKLINTIYRRYNKRFYNISFNEGIEFNTIELSSSKKIPDAEEHKNLKKIIYDSNDGYTYLLYFENSKELSSFKNKIEQNEYIKKIDLNLV